MIEVTGKKSAITGEIVYENKFFITVQGANYRECFLKTDIKNGFYKVEEIAEKD